MVLTRVPTKIKQKTSGCRQEPCPSCGGLGCMERPRYFHGQLLTDKDLDAAQRYVIEKNRLHNRYLVGTGVVCGLAVRCDPCDGVVTIEPGYAIDCCGNDIVACDPVRFDVIDYIEKCFRREEPGCEGKIRSLPPTRCDDRPKEYCLTISFAEEHTRPVTALAHGGSCKTDRCEPSRTLETFRFDLEEVQDKGKEPRFQVGGMFGRVQASVAEVMPLLQQYTQEMQQIAGNDNPQQFHNQAFDLLCRMKEAILKLDASGPRTRCNLRAELDEIEAGFPAFTEDPERRPAYLQAVQRSLFLMLSRLLRHLLDEICDALLVPCTPCEDEEMGVLLACLTICDGKVIEICNTVRKQVMSGPALYYYLQPLYDMVSMLIDQLCCGDLFDRTFRVVGNRAEGLSSARVAYTRMDSTLRMAQDFSSAAFGGLRKANFANIFTSANLGAADLYRKPAAEVRADLESLNVTVVERAAATAEEAYTLRNLSDMAWNVPAGSRVELITDAEKRVTGLRVLREKDS